MKKLLILAVTALAVLISGCATHTRVVVTGGPSVMEYIDANGVVWIVEYDGPQGWRFENVYVSGVFYPVYWTTDFMFYRGHSHLYYGHGYARHSGRFDHSGHRGYRNHDGAGRNHQRDGHPGYYKDRHSAPKEGRHPGKSIRNAPRNTPRSTPRSKDSGEKRHR